MQELKKNQELQEYISLLENRMHHPDKECKPGKQVLYLLLVCTPNQFIFLDYHLPFVFISLLKDSCSALIRGPVSCPNPAGSPNLLPSQVSGYNSSSYFSSACSSPEAGRQGENQSSNTKLGDLEDSRQEMQDLKEQLEALKCQVSCSLQHSIEKIIPFVMWFELNSCQITVARERFG